mmetsp:Transcript_48173/g.119323  ORF Transcript_48173/g.119323 Transcript_48173/m.119323 type:complete len:240 (-) Transcript_48173:4-723(-)
MNHQGDQHETYSQQDPRLPAHPCACLLLRSPPSRGGAPLHGVVVEVNLSLQRRFLPQARLFCGSFSLGFLQLLLAQRLLRSTHALAPLRLSVRLLLLSCLPCALHLPRRHVALVHAVLRSEGASPVLVRLVLASPLFGEDDQEQVVALQVPRGLVGHEEPSERLGVEQRLPQPHVADEQLVGVDDAGDVFLECVCRQRQEDLGDLMVFLPVSEGSRLRRSNIREEVHLQTRKQRSRTGT